MGELTVPAAAGEVNGDLASSGAGAGSLAAAGVVGVPPYQRAELGDNRRWGEYHAAPFRRIAEAVLDVVRQEGPVHEDALATRVAGSWGLQQVGRRVRGRIETVLADAERQGIISRREAFLWPPDLTTAAVRGPAADGSVRPVTEIPPEEIAGAIALVAARARDGLTRDELILGVAKIFGYKRRGSQVDERIGAAIDAARAAGRLRLTGERLYAAPGAAA